MFSRIDLFFPSGSCDIYSLPEVKGQSPKLGEVPTYVNTQHIDPQVLAALQGETEAACEPCGGATAKDSPRKDLFDMSKAQRRLLYVFKTDLLRSDLSVRQKKKKKFEAVSS